MFAKKKAAPLGDRLFSLNVSVLENHHRFADNEH